MKEDQLALSLLLAYRFSDYTEKRLSASSINEDISQPLYVKANSRTLKTSFAVNDSMADSSTVITAMVSHISTRQYTVIYLT